MTAGRWLRLAGMAAILATGAPADAGRITDQVVFQVAATGPVRFSHYRHLAVLGNDCVQCHKTLFNIIAAENPTFTMADMAEGKSCGGCHNGREAFGISGNCGRCHPTRAVQFTVADAGNVTFSHNAHTPHFGCAQCHPDLFRPREDNPAVSMEQMEEGLSCGACHDGATAFGVSENCEQCHAM